MNKMERERIVEETFKITRMIWFLMMGALFPYTLVGLVFGSDNGGPLFFKIQAGFGLVALCLPSVARFQMARIMIKRDPDEMGERFHEIASNRYHTAKVVEMAMYESIGVMGLVLAVLGAMSYVFLCFMAYALVLLIMYRPSKKDLWAYLDSLA